VAAVPSSPSRSCRIWTRTSAEVVLCRLVGYPTNRQMFEFWTMSEVGATLSLACKFR
jgi:hypothetical protein